MTASASVTRDSGLSPYQSLPSLLEEAQQLCRLAGGVAFEYGKSVEGRPLLALQLPGHGDKQVMFSANLHGPEFIAAEVALGLLRRAVAGDLDALREKATVFILPCLNPDGYEATWNAAGNGNLAALRTNAHGVDLNRNFPLPPGVKRSRLPGQGSSKKGHATYRGPAPLSEPESAALAKLLEEQPFWASVNGHSFMGTCIPPRVTHGDDVKSYRELCKTFADGQKENRYWRLASVMLDGFTGELEDYQHHRFGTWAITLESFPWSHSLVQTLLSPSLFGNLFWRFNPKDKERWVDNDVPGVLAFWEAALAMPAPQQQLG